MRLRVLGVRAHAENGSDVPLLEESKMRPKEHSAKSFLFFKFLSDVEFENDEPLHDIINNICCRYLANASRKVRLNSHRLTKIRQ